ncbi:MAG: twin-arginine translocation signal domain-containing protein [Nocardioidaceae bacterium]
MSQSTRRGFLGMAGAGAAAIGVAAVAPTALAADGGSKSGGRRIRSAKPVVAHVPDPRLGNVSLMVGEREVVVHDRDLVARLVEAAKE